MMILLICAFLVSVATASPISGSGPHLVGDSPQARTLFFLADIDHDSQLTRTEFHSIFIGFDKDVNGQVSLSEFITEWKTQAYGTDSQGIQLFINLDANRDTVITEIIDMPYIFHFFDRNADNHVTEGEFVTQWVKIST